MAAVNQRIANFLGGVSQQPDTIKYPGQVRVCDNAVPDVTFGLMKRPPGEYINKLANTTSTGYWYEILRDGDEKYLVQITPGNTGSHPIRVWDIFDGTEKSLTNSSGDSLYAYLAQTGTTQKYDLQSIQDYTIITNPKKVVGTTGTTDAPIQSGNYSFVKLNTLAYNTEYVLYTSATPPSTNTYYRATSLKIEALGISGVTITNGGTGYTNGAAVSFSGGGGSGAAGDVIVNASNVITGVNITSKGSGYTSAPTVTFVGLGSGTPGSGATGTATVNDGQTWDSTDNTQSKSGGLAFSFSGGSSVTIPGGSPVCENLEGTATVQGHHYIYSQNKNFDNSGNTAAENFLGYTQTYHTRYTSTVTLKSGGIIKTTNKTTAEDHYIEIDVEGEKYNVSVEAVEPVETFEGIDDIAYYKTPISADKGRASMASVLKGLADSVNSGSQPRLANVTAEVIGNGLYCYGTSAPSINFLGGTINEGMNVISKTAPNVASLPNMCKHGYVIQISNSANADADNYYLKFLADNGSYGAGKWEETVQPHNFFASTPMVKGLDPATMPHALVNNRNGTFTFKKLDETTATAAGNDLYWKYREVGDDETNPMPSFNGLNIQKIFFHRNRLGLVADEQIVMSRPGDYFNYFIVSALTTSDDNPIDITMSDVKPAFVNHVLPVPQGVMMFSDNGQFILFTESDLFTPKTARLKKLSSYECSTGIQPIDMGTSVMYTSDTASYTRVWETVMTTPEAPPTVMEQTRVVPEYVPQDITMSANTQVLGLVTFGKKGDTALYHYKYYDVGKNRDQSAWYSWTLNGTLQHMFYSAGIFYTVTYQDTQYILNRHEYLTNAASSRSYTLGTGTVGSPLTTSRWFEGHLDNMYVPAANEITYTPKGGPVTGPDFTDVALPYSPTTTLGAPGNFYVVALQGTDANGNSVAGQWIQANSTYSTIAGDPANKATFEGVDMRTWTIAVGYGYISTIGLPTYYFQLEPGMPDIDGDLRISGFNFNMGVSGPMEFHLESTYADMDDFVQYESGMIANSSQFGKPPTTLHRSVRVPVQKKNNKYNLTIKIPGPFATALISGSWDGNYNQRRHVRR